MAFMVELVKEHEDEESVSYSFKSIDASGSLTLDKRSGKIDGEGDEHSGRVRFAFERAARKLALAHEKRDYPEKLTWQS